MKISIITPNYNGARFLEECVQSIHSQVCPEVEVEHIVIDGGSRDGSLDILRRYRSGITHLISEPDFYLDDSHNYFFTNQKQPQA